METLTFNSVFMAVYNAYSKTQEFQKVITCIKETGKDVNKTLEKAYSIYYKLVNKQHTYDVEPVLYSTLKSELGCNSYGVDCAVHVLSTIESVMEASKKYDKLITKCNTTITQTQDEDKLNTLNSFKEEVLNAQEEFINGMDKALENIVEARYGKGKGLDVLENEWLTQYIRWTHRPTKLTTRFKEINKAKKVKKAK